MTLALSDWLIVALYFIVSAGHRPDLHPPGQRVVGRVFRRRACAPLVAGRDLDGRDHLRRGYAARRRGAGLQVRGGRQLALVERRDLGNPDRVLLRPALAARRRPHRSRIRRDPLWREAGGRPAGVSSAVSRASHQPDHHGVGHPCHGDDPPDLARHPPLDRGAAPLRRDGAVHDLLRACGEWW